MPFHAAPDLAAATLPSRRAVLALLPAAVGATLAGCAAPLPPVTWVRLPVDEPGAASAGLSPRTLAIRPAGDSLPRGGAPVDAAASAQIGAPVWQLMAPVALPGHLDRDALLLPQGSAGRLQAQGQVRWAEPLRDAVPRLLRLDLSRALGAPVWAAPLPPGLQPTHQLRVELLALDVQPGGRSVLLQARYSVADAQGRRAPRAGDLRLVVHATGTDADALVLAHRQALAQLATQLAALVWPS